MQLKDDIDTGILSKAIVPDSLSPGRKSSSSSSSGVKVATTSYTMASLASPKQISKPMPTIEQSAINPIRAVPITEVPVLRSKKVYLISEEGLAKMICDYCTNEALDMDEVLYHIKDAENSFSDISLRRTHLLTLRPNQDISVNTFDAYTDYLNMKSVKDDKIVKRWIFHEQFTYYTETQPSQGSKHGKIQDIVAFTWARDCDFSQVDYWFMHVNHDGNYIVFVIDHVNKRYHFLDSMQKESFKYLYEYLGEKVFNFVKVYCDRQFPEGGKKVPDNGYKWNLMKRIKQKDTSIAGLYALDWCANWDGQYKGRMKKSNASTRRMEILKTLVTCEGNLELPVITGKACRTD